jgi:hypothetical protein
MSRLMSFGALCGISLVLLGVSVRADDFVLLTPDQIKSEIVGKVQTGKDKSGGYWFLTVYADGTIELTEGRFRDLGKWSFEGTSYCTLYQRVRGGAKLCQGIARVAGGYAYIVDGKIEETFTVK